LLCGIAAMFAQALSNPDSPYPIIGANGATSRCRAVRVLNAARETRGL